MANPGSGTRLLDESFRDPLIVLVAIPMSVFGVVPLLVASGLSAVSRFDMGLVIATGLTIASA